MKILHTEASIGWGGQEIRILKESLGMIKRGHEVFLIVQKNGGLVEKARAHGIKVYEVDFKKKKSLFLLFKLIMICKKEKIDLINTHSSLDSWIGGITARICKIRVIRTRHLSTKIQSGLNSYLLYNKLADYVMTTCQEIVPIIQRQAKIPSSRVASVPTGIDILSILEKKDTHKKFRKDLGVEDHDFLVGMVCFMRSWKGVDDFIDAANLSRGIPHLKWVIIGGGHEEKYRIKAKKLGIENLYFTGHLENPFSAISSIDAFCLLSTAHEGVSQASLQAALFEKPLITTETGGLKEVCIDKQTGIIVPCHSPEKVKDAALFLKENYLQASLLGKKAKEHVEMLFSFDKMLNRIEEIYISLS